MGKIEIIDEILVPSGYISINFKGKNPFKACDIVRDLYKTVMKLTSKDIFELDLRWDITSEPREFYGKWVGVLPNDRWSETKVKITIQGAQSTKDQTGWATIRIEGLLETGYEYANFIQRGFWWAYNYLFYYKQRRNYIEYGKDLIYEIRDRFKETLGISHE